MRPAVVAALLFAALGPGPGTASAQPPAAGATRAAAAAPGEGPRSWHATADPARPFVWGWRDAAGYIRFHAHEQATAPPREATPKADPTPTPTPTPAPIGQNFGLSLERMHRPSAGGSYTASGPTAAAFAKAAIDRQSGVIADLEDDTAALRLTVIGAQADRARVLADLKADAPLREAARGMLVQDYDPGDWAVTSVGLPATGRPSLHVQAGDGTVLYSADDYAGPDELSAALGRLRKPNPDFDPSRALNPLARLDGSGLLAAAAVVAAALLLGSKRPR